MKTNPKIFLLAASLMVPAAVSQAADGKKLFEKNCAICHSKDGTGQAPMGIALKARNFTDVAWQDTIKDEEIIKSINEGRLDPVTKKEKMKPFAKLLSAADIKALAGHVRSFKGGASGQAPRVLDIGPLAQEPGAAPAGAAAPAAGAVAPPAAALGGGQLDLISHAYILASLGSHVEQQNALATLAAQETPAVSMIILQAVDKLLAGQVRPEMQLDLLELAGKRSEPIIKEKLQKFESSRSTGDPLSFYSELLAGGNTEAGHNVFFDKPEAGCFACHMINGKGGAVGPNLTGIGSRKSREYLLNALMDPDKDIATGFLTLNVTMQDGTIISGLVKSETDQSLIIDSPEDGEVEVVRANIITSEPASSPMPPELVQALPKRDVRDLLEFLCNLKESLYEPHGEAQIAKGASSVTGSSLAKTQPSNNSPQPTGFE